MCLTAHQSKGEQMVKLLSLTFIIGAIIVALSVSANTIQQEKELANAYENARELTVLLAKSKNIEIDRQVKLDVATQKEQHCLAKNIFYEAGNESVNGKIAVAQVTVQRSEHPKYPDNICDVVYQKTAEMCQFSWYCDLAVQQTKATIGPAWEESKRIAKRVLVDGVRLPEIKGALFYKANYAPNDRFWNSLTPVATLGVHVFYKRR